MSYPHATRFDNLAFHAGPSPLGVWFATAWRRLQKRKPQTPTPRDRAREAAEVRTWAMTVQQTDPHFAADLFAAADRHEAAGA